MVIRRVTVTLGIPVGKCVFIIVVESEGHRSFAGFGFVKNNVFHFVRPQVPVASRSTGYIYNIDLMQSLAHNGGNTFR